MGLGGALGLSPFVPRGAYAGVPKAGGTYTVEKDVVSGGGAVKAGGSYSASAVVGQPSGYQDMAGGTYTLHGGYYGGHDEDPPGIDVVAYFDTNTDGVVDELVVSFSEPVKDNTINVADVVAGFSLGSGAVASVDNVTDGGGFAKANGLDPGVANDNYITLSVSGYTNGTGVTTVSFTQQPGRFHDHSQLQLPSVALANNLDMAPARIKFVQGRVGSANLLVKFTEPVYTNPGSAGDLVAGDFAYTDGDDSRTILGVTHTAGMDTAVVQLSVALDGSNDLLTDTLAANATQIYDAGSLASATNAVTVTERVLVWTGAVNTDMSNPGNWDGNRIPSFEDRLVITNSGSTPATVDAGLAAVGGVTVNPGATLNGGVNTLDMQGNFIVSGVFTPGTGTVSFSSAGGYTLSASQVHDLAVGAGGVTVLVSPSHLLATGGIALAGALSVSVGVNVDVQGGVSGVGSVDLSGSSVFSVGGTMDLTGGSLACGTTSTCLVRLLGPVTSLGAFTPGLGAVEFGNTTGGQNIPSITYNDLIISNSGQVAMLLAPTAISGDLKITTGTSTLNGGGQNVNLSGSLLVLANNASPLNNFTLTLVGVGNTQDLSFSGNIQNLAVNKTGGKARLMHQAGGPVVFSAFGVSSGEFDMNGRTLAFGSGATAVLTGGVFTADLTGSKLTSDNPGVNRYSFEVNGGALSVSNLIVESVNASGLSFSAGTITAFDNVEWRQGQTRFAAFGGALGAVSFNNHYFDAPLTNNLITSLGSTGTITVTGATGPGAGPLYEQELGAVINWPGLFVLSGNCNNNDSLAIAVNGAITATPACSAGTYATNVAASPGDKVVIFYDNVATRGAAVFVASGADLPGVNLTASNVVVYNFQSPLTGIGTTDLITASGVGPVDADIPWTVNAGTQVRPINNTTFYVPAGHLLDNSVNNGLDYQVGVNGTIVVNGTLDVGNNVMNVWPSSANMTVSGTLHIGGAGSLEVNHFDAAGGAVVMSAGAVIGILGNVASVGSNTTTAGTWQLTGASGQTFPAATVYNLQFQNAACGAPQVLTGPVNVNNNLTIASSCLGTGGFDLSVSGNLTGNGDFNISDSSVVSVGGDFNRTANTAFTGTAVGTLRLLGTVSNLGASFTAGMGTVEYGSTTLGQAVQTVNYNNLTISNSGQVASLAAPVTVSGDFLIATDTSSFDAVGQTVTLKGNFTSLGANANPVTNLPLTLNGDLPLQALSVSDTLNSLVVNKTTGKARLNNSAGDMTVSFLTLSSGELDLNGRVLRLTNTATASLNGGVFRADLTGSKITSDNPGVNRYAFDVNGATLSVGNLIFESADANGLVFTAGAITALDNVEWRQGLTRFASFGGALGALSFNNHYFDAALTNNFRTTGGSTGSITVNNATGPGAGPAYEDQQGAAINWPGIVLLSGLCNGADTMAYAANGVVRGTFACSGGSYAANAQASAGEKVVVFYDNVATRGAAVFVASGADTPGLNITPSVVTTYNFQNPVTGITTGDLITASGVGPVDADIPWTVNAGAEVRPVTSHTWVVPVGHKLAASATNGLDWDAGRAGTIKVEGDFTTGGFSVQSYPSAVAVLVSGSLTVNGDGFNTGDLDATSGSVNLGGAGVLHIGGNAWGLASLSASTGTVVYDGAGPQTVAAATYNNVSFQNSACGSPKSLAGNILVNGNVTLNAGCVDIGPHTAQVAGSTTNTAGASTIQIGSGTYMSQGTYDLTGGTATTSFTGTGQLAVQGPLLGLGTLDIGAGYGLINMTYGAADTFLPGGVTYNDLAYNAPGRTLHLGGGAATGLRSFQLSAGTLAQAGDLNLSGSWNDLGGVYQPSLTNSVTFVGINSQVASQSATNWFPNVTFNKTGGSLALSTSVTVSGTATVSQAGNYLSLNSNTLKVAGDFNAPGVFQPATGAVLLSPSVPVGVTMAGGNYFPDLTVENGVGKTVNLSSDVMVAQNFVKADAGSMRVMTFTLGVSGSAGLIGGGLRLNDVVSAGGIMSVSGPFTQNGGNLYLNYGGQLYLGNTYDMQSGILGNDTPGATAAQIGSVNPGVVFPTVNLAAQISNSVALSFSSIANTGVHISPSATVLAFDNVSYASFQAGATCLDIDRNGPVSHTFTAHDFDASCNTNVNANGATAAVDVNMASATGARAGEAFDVETGTATVSWGVAFSIAGGCTATDTLRVARAGVIGASVGCSGGVYAFNNVFGAPGEVFTVYVDDNTDGVNDFAAMFKADGNNVVGITLVGSQGLRVVSQGGALTTEELALYRPADTDMPFTLAGNTVVADGAAAIVVSGGATLVVSASHPLTASTMLAVQSGGLLHVLGQVQADGPLNVQAGGNLQLDNNALLVLASTPTAINGFTFSDSAVVRYEAAGAGVNVLGAVYPNLEIKRTTQTSLLNGNTTVSGSLTIVNGVLDTNGMTLWVSGSTTITNAATSRLRMNGSTVTLAGNVTNDKDIWADAGGQLRLLGAYTGTNANSDLRVNAAAAVASVSGSYNATGGATTFTADGALWLDGPLTSLGALNIGAGYGTLSLSYASGGTTLNNSNTYHRVVYNAPGRNLSFGAGGATGIHTLSVSAGTLNLLNNMNLSGSLEVIAGVFQPVVATPTVNFVGTGAQTVDMVASNWLPGVVMNKSGGMITLLDNATVSGSLTVNNTGNYFDPAGYDLVVKGGVNAAIGVFQPASGTVVISPSSVATINLGAGSNFFNHLTVDNGVAEDVSLATNVHVAGNLGKTGLGALSVDTLALSVSGSVTLSAGDLQLNNGASEGLLAVSGPMTQTGGNLLLDYGGQLWLGSSLEVTGGAITHLSAGGNPARVKSLNPGVLWPTIGIDTATLNIIQPLSFSYIAASGVRVSQSATVTAFNNVAFDNFQAGSTCLDIDRTGVVNLTFNNHFFGANCSTNVSADGGGGTATLTMLTSTGPRKGEAYDAEANGATVVWGVPIALSASHFFDQNANGKVDRMVVEFTQNLNDATASLANAQARFTVQGVAGATAITDIDAVTAGGACSRPALDPGVANDAFITFCLNEGNFPNTHSQSVAFTTNPGDFADAEGNDTPASASVVAVDAAPPVILYAQSFVGTNVLLVSYSEPVYSNPGGTGNLASGDYTVTDGDNSRTVVGVTHTAGNPSGNVNLSAALDASNDLGTDTLAAAATQIYDLAGNAVATTPVTLTERVLTWIGAANINMNNAANWDFNRVPTNNDRVVITNTGVTPATVNALINTRGLTVNAGATLDGGSSILQISGDFIVNGTYTPNSGNVTVAGAGVNYLSASTFNALDVSTGVAELLVDATAASSTNVGTLSLGAGIDLQITGNVTNTGTLQLNDNATLDINGAFNSTNNVNMTGTSQLRLGGTITAFNTLAATGGTVIYDSAAANQPVSALTYNHLTINNNGFSAQVQLGAVVGGDLTLTGAGANLDGNGQNLVLQGSLIQQGPVTTPLTNLDVDLTGTGPQVISMGAYILDLTINKASGVVSMSTTVGVTSLGALTLTAGQFDLNGKSIEFTNGAAVAINGGVFSAHLTGSKITSTNPGVNRYAFTQNNGLLSVSNLIFESADNNGLNFSGGTIGQLDNVVWGQPGNTYLRLNAPLGSLTVNNHYFNTVALNNVVTTGASSGTLTLVGTAGAGAGAAFESEAGAVVNWFTPFTLSGTCPNNGATLKWARDGAWQADTTCAVGVYSVLAAAAPGQIITVWEDDNVALVDDRAVVFKASGGAVASANIPALAAPRLRILDVAGGLTTAELLAAHPGDADMPYSNGGGYVLMDASGELVVDTGAELAVVSGTPLDWTAGGQLDVVGQFVVSASAVATVPGNLLATGIVQNSGSLDLGGDLNVTGQLQLGEASVTSLGGTLTSFGALTFSNSARIDLDDVLANQSLPAGTYPSLSISKLAKDVNLAGAVIVSGSLNIADGLLNTGANNLTVSGTTTIGSVVGSGLRVAGGVTTLAGAVTNNRDLSVSGPATVTMLGNYTGNGVSWLRIDNSAAQVTVNGTYNATGNGTAFSANGTLTLAGPLTSLGSLNLGGGFGKIVAAYTGGPTTLPNTTFNDITLAATGQTVTLGGASTNVRHLTVSAGTLNQAGAIVVTGNWDDTGGVFQSTTGTVTFNGTAAQTISQSAANYFYDLSSSKTGGSLTLNSNITVTDDVVITDTGAYLNLGSRTLEARRNFSASGGVFNPASGTVLLKPSVAATVNLGAGFTNSFNHLTADLTTANLDLGNDLKVAGDFAMTGAGVLAANLNTLAVSGSATLSNGTLRLNNGGGNPGAMAVSGLFTQAGGVLDVQYGAALYLGTGLVQTGGSLTNTAATANAARISSTQPGAVWPTVSLRNVVNNTQALSFSYIAVGGVQVSPSTTVTAFDNVGYENFQTGGICLRLDRTAPITFNFSGHSFGAACNVNIFASGSGGAVNVNMLGATGPRKGEPYDSESGTATVTWGAPIQLSEVHFYDMNANGALDRAVLSFSTNLNDATFNLATVQGALVIGGVAGATAIADLDVASGGACATSMPPIDPQVAHDRFVTLCLAEANFAGTYSRSVAFTQPGGAFQDFDLNEAPTNAAVTSVDAAKPLLKYAQSYVNSDAVLAEFTEAVFTNAGAGALVAGDFNLTDGDNSRTVIGVTHNAGDVTASVQLSAALDDVNDVGTDALAPWGTQIYDIAGNAAPATSSVTLSERVLVWTGAVNTTMTNPANWDLNRAPTADDRLVITSAGSQPAWANPSMSARGVEVLAGGTLDVGANTLTLSGDLVVQGGGAFNPASGTVAFNSPVGVSTNAASFANLTVAAGTPLVLSANAAVSGTLTNAGNLSFSNATTLTVATFTGTGLTAINSTGAVTVNSDMNVAGGTLVCSGGVNCQIILAGNLTSLGTFTPGVGTLVVANTGGLTTLPDMAFNHLIINTGAQTVMLGGASTAVNNLTLSSGTLAQAGAITVNGNWNDAAGSFLGSALVTFGGGNAQTITQAPANSFNQLTFNKSASTVTLASNITATGAVNVLHAADRVNLNGFTLEGRGNFDASAGVFTPANGTVLLKPAAPSNFNLGGGFANYFNHLTVDLTTANLNMANDTKVAGNYAQTGTGTLTTNLDTLAVSGSATLSNGVLQLNNGAAGGVLAVSGLLSQVGGTLEIQYGGQVFLGTGLNQTGGTLLNTAATANTARISSTQPGVVWPTVSLGSVINNSQALSFSYLANTGVVVTNAATLTSLNKMGFSNFQAAATCLSVDRAAGVNLTFDQHDYDANCVTNVSATSSVPTFTLTMTNSTGAGKGEPNDNDGSNANVVWGVPIALDTVTYYDISGDGRLDKMKVQFTGALVDSTVALGDAQSAFTVNGVAGATALTDIDTTFGGGCATAPGDPGTVNDNLITLCLNEPSFLTTRDLSVSFTTQAGKFRDGDLNQTPTSASVATADAASPVLVGAYGTVGSDQVFVQFSEPVWTNAGPSGALVAGDFGVTDGDDSRTVTGVAYGGGLTEGSVTLSTPLDSSNDLNTDSVAPVATQVYDAAGNAALTTPRTVQEGLVTWTGAVDTDWFNTGNWTPARVPQVFDNVTITGAGSQPVTLNAPSQVVGVTLAAGTLSLGGAAVLSMSGNLSGAATLTANPASVVAFNGQINQSTDKYAFGAVVVDKPTGNLLVTGAGAAQVSANTLTVNAGVADFQNQPLQLGGDLTLNGAGQLLSVPLEETAGAARNITLNATSVISMSSFVQNAVVTTNFVDNRAGGVVPVAGGFNVTAGLVNGPASVLSVGAGSVLGTGDFSNTVLRLTGGVVSLTPPTATAVKELQVASTGGATLAGDLRVSGSVLLSGGVTLNAAGNDLAFERDMDAAGSGTVSNVAILQKVGAAAGVLSGAAPITVGEVLVSGTGGLTLLSDATVTGPVNLTGQGLNWSGLNLTVQGSFLANTTANPGGAGSFLVMTGGSPATLSASPQLGGNLTVNKAATLTTPGPLYVASSLYLQSGTLATNGDLSVERDVNMDTGAVLSLAGAYGLRLVGGAPSVMGGASSASELSMSRLAIDKTATWVQFDKPVRATNGFALNTGTLTQNGQTLLTSLFATSPGATYTHGGGAVIISGSAGSITHQATGNFQDLTLNTSSTMSVAGGSTFTVDNNFTHLTPAFSASNLTLTTKNMQVASSLDLLGTGSVVFENVQVTGGVLGLSGSVSLLGKTGANRAVNVYAGGGFRSAQGTLAHQNAGVEFVSFTAGGNVNISNLTVNDLASTGLVITPSAVITSLSGINFNTAQAGATCLTVQRTGGPHNISASSLTFGAGCNVNISADGGGGTTSLNVLSTAGPRAGENFDSETNGANVAWGSAPVVTAARQFDVDGDGSVDEIAVQFDKALVDATLSNADAGRFTWGGAALVGVDNVTSATGSARVNTFDPGVANDAFITLFTGDAAGLGTGLKTLAYTTAANRLEDSLGNDAATNASLPLADYAKPVLLGRLTRDLNGSGSLDAVRLSFSENLNDATVNAAQFAIAGATGLAFSGVTGGDVANNNILFISFTDGALSTGATPTVGYTAGTLADGAGNLMNTVAPTAAADGAGPVLLSATAADDGTVLTGIDNDDTVTLVFSEATTQPAVTAANLPGAFTLSGGHSWLSGAGSITAASWLTATTLKVTLNITSGAPTIAAGDTVTVAGALIADAAGNTGLGAKALSGSFSADTSQPAMLSVTTLDNNVDGYIGVVRVLFNKSIKDSTVGAAQFSLAGAGPLTFSASYGGDTADNTTAYFTFADGVLHSGLTPTFTYTAGTLTDLPGNPMPTQSLTPADGAAPVLLSAVASDDGTVFNGIDNDDTVTLTFSEPTNQAAITAANINAVLTLPSGKSWLGGGGQITAATWLTAAVLRVTLNTTGGAPSIAPGQAITVAGGVILGAGAGLAAVGSKTLAGTFAADTTPPTFAGLTGAATNTSFGQTVTLSWSVATDTTPPMSYQLYVATTSGGQNFATPALTVTGSGPVITVDYGGLTNDTPYYFVVRATDGAGNQDANTVERTATPRNPDSTPPALTVNAPPDGFITNLSPITVAGVTEAGATVTAGGTPLSVDGSGNFSGPVNLTVGANTIAVIATDAGGNAATVTLNLTLDQTSPTVALDMPLANDETNPLSGSVDIIGTVADDRGVAGTVAEYGPGASPTSWKQIGSTVTGAQTVALLATWNTSILKGTYTLRLTTTDLAGNTAQTTRTVYVANATGTPIHIAQGGWRFFSLPGMPVPNDPKVFLGNGMFNLRWWDPEEPNMTGPLYKYKTEFTVQPGMSFWVKAYDNDLTPSITLAAQDTTQDFIRAMPVGWNMIGMPFSRSMPISDLRFIETATGSELNFQAAVTADWIDGNLWEFDGTGFVAKDVTQDQLTPYAGCFINIKRPLSVRILPGSGDASGVARIVRQPLPSFQVKVAGELPGSHVADRENRLGLRYTAADAYDNTDRAEPPVMEDEPFLHVFTEGRDAQGGALKLAESYQTATATGALEKQWTVVSRTNVAGAVDLAVSVLSNENNAYEAFLTDPDTNQQVPLGVGGARFAYTAPGGVSEKRFVITVKRTGASLSKVAGTIPAGWQLVSFPIEAEPSKASAQLGDDVNPLEIYQYYESAFTQVGKGEDVDLQAGLGFWMRLDAPATVDVEGVLVPDGQPIEVPLKKGWNLLGNPWQQPLPFGQNILVKLADRAEAIPLQEAYAQGIITPPLFGQAPQSTDYEATDVLQPWKGYFIQSKVDATLILKP